MSGQTVPGARAIDVDTALDEIRNLVSNTVKHNEEPVPHVTVTATEQEHAALVEVTDNGPGIPEEQAGKLFQMGEKGIDSSGTGLSLSLCQRIVETFGG